MSNIYGLFKSVLGIPGDLEDTAQWMQWLRSVAEFAVGEGTVWIVTGWVVGIPLLLYASSGWWSRFVPFLKSVEEDPIEEEPSDDEIERFRDLNRWVVHCQDNLDMWVSPPPGLENVRDKQLDATLLSFRILCRRLDELKVWTPSPVEEAKIDEAFWSSYLLRLRLLTVQAALSTARKRGSDLATPSERS